MVQAAKMKWHALKTLASQSYLFENWREIFKAYVNYQPMPELRFRNGMVITHRPTDPAWSLVEEVFVNHCYTSKSFYRPKSTDVVMDIGANIGIFTLYLQNAAPGITVNCFEPSSSNRKQLEQNILKNGFSSHVKIHPFAILNEKTTKTLKHAGASGSHSIFLPGENGEAGEQVNCISLKDAIDRCQAKTIDLLKIDTEGAEVEILSGVEEDVWGKVKRVTLEYHDDVRPGAKEAVLKVLSQHFKTIKDFPANSKGDLGVLQAS